MRCNKCGTLVEGSNGTCPLCGAPMAVQKPVYAPRKPKVSNYVVPFTVVFWIVALAATVVAGSLCVVFWNGVHYWAIVLTGCLWLYSLLRHTILGIENLHYKILINTIIGLTLLAVIGFVLHREDVLMGWVIPFFYLASCVLDGVVALTSISRARRFMLSLWWQGLLAVAIFAFCFSMHLYWWPSVICGGVGLLLSLVITVSHPREVWAQIKRAVDM